MSDDSGAFQINDLAAGAYLVRIQATGFRSEVRPLSLKPGEQREISIGVQVAGLVENVVVTASGTAQSAQEVAKAVTVIDGRDMERRNDITLADALSTTPGLRLQQLGGPLSLTNIRIRGLRNQDTALLVDGVPFRDVTTLDSDATAFLEDFTILDTQRIEILRGSGSSLYGSNAIGGAINIITDPGGAATRGKLQLEGGGPGLFRGFASLSGGTSDGSFSYSAGLGHLNLSSGIDDSDAGHNTSGQGRLQWNPASGISLAGRVFAADSRLQLRDSPFALADNLPGGQIIPAIPLPGKQRRLLQQGNPFQAGAATFVPGLVDPDNRRSARFFDGMIKLTHQLTSSFSYTAAYSFTDTRRRFDDGPAGAAFEPLAPVFTNFRGQVQLLQIHSDWRLGEHNIVSAGYQFEKDGSDTLDHLDDGSEVLTNLSERSHSLFLQDQLLLDNRRLQISVAGRGQWFSLAQPRFLGQPGPYHNLERFASPPAALTADGSLSYFFRSSGTKLRVHVGNSYRTPSLFNRFGSTFFFGSFSYFGDPRLRPERSVSVDTGLDQSLASDRVRLSASYFYSRLQQVILFDFSGAIDPLTDPFGRSGGYLNGGGGISRGLEVSARVSPTSNLDLSASYTYTDSRQSGQIFENFDRTLGVSRHEGTLALFYRVSPRLDVTFSLDAVGDYFISFFGVNRPFRFHGPVKADLGAGYRLLRSDRQNVRFFVKVSNVFNDDYFEDGFLTPGLNARGGLSFQF